MRFTFITAAASLAGAAFALPIVDTSASGGVVKDIEGLTKVPVQTRQAEDLVNELTGSLKPRLLNGPISQVEKLTGTGSLKAREEKDPMHEALASIFKSVSGRQVDGVEALVGETVQPIVTEGVAKRQTELIEELTNGLSLPTSSLTKRQTEIIEELTNGLTLPTNSLTKRQTDGLLDEVDETVNEVYFPLKRQTEALGELANTDELESLTEILRARQLAGTVETVPANMLSSTSLPSTNVRRDSEISCVEDVDGNCKLGLLQSLEEAL